MENQIWKDITGFEGSYMISESGEIKSLARLTNSGHGLVPNKGRILKVHKGKRGYIMVTLSLKMKSFLYPLHRLLALHFIPNPENKSTVNHKNGIKTDNRLENLEWCSQKENVVHAFKFLNPVMSHGEKHYKSKLTEEDVKEIRKLYAQGGISYKKIGEKYGVIDRTIGNIITGTGWRSV